MKVQWQLMDIETKETVRVGEEFELVDFMKSYFNEKTAISWEESCNLFGDPMAIKNPLGFINITS